MINDIKGFIENEQLLEPQSKVLVAVSGGVDSMVLAWLLNQLAFDIGIAHANFQLRGTESDTDELFTRRFAQNLNLPFYSKKFDTTGKAKSEGISTQMAARRLRYRWFEELRTIHHYQAIATAHHADDVLETLLLNLTRGTGISGLHGIFPRKDFLVRPLLFATKQQIVEFAQSQKLDWREDQSNQSDYYQRNLIRNQVVPLLKQINPNLTTTTMNTVEILRSVERQYHKSLAQLREQFMIHQDQTVMIPKLEIEHMSAPLLYDLIQGFGFNLKQCRSLLQDAFQQSGKMFFSSSHVLNVDRDQIIIAPIPGGVVELVIEGFGNGVRLLGNQNWQLTEYQADGYKIKSDRWVVALDMEKVTFPLKVRRWTAGDRFRPLGMTGFKKISDFLIDNKIPMHSKTDVQVLLSKGRIAWLVGHRIDDRFKITANTDRVLEILVTNTK